MLRHSHLSRPGAPISYHAASAAQDALVAEFLAFKKHPDITRPRPALLTFELAPTYTFGRRQQHDAESARKIAELRSRTDADAVYALRGGQTTFHGPGQLVAYPVLDLREFNLSSKCYVRLLENAGLELLREFGLNPLLTSNPGVWLSPTDKICSVGVHLRRHITSHGIAINAATDLAYFDYIAACGLPDATAVSIKSAAGAEWSRQMAGLADPIRALADRFANILDKSLKGLGK